MKINFDQVLKDLNGNPIPSRLANPVGKGEPQKMLTLKDVCLNALLANIPGEQLTGKQKFEQYENATMINKGGVINITAEFITKLKERIGKIYTILVVGQSWNMLEKDEEKVQDVVAPEVTEEK